MLWPTTSRNLSPAHAKTHRPGHTRAREIDRQLPLLDSKGLQLAREGAASGRLTAARRIFSAAFSSAWAENPHATQRNCACDFRLARSQCPHCEQVWLV